MRDYANSRREWAETSRRGRERSPWLSPDWLDAERELLEAGPGGDVDADGRLMRAGYSYVPSLKRTVSRWLRLYEQVQSGALGGPLDGQRLNASRLAPRTPDE